MNPYLLVVLLALLGRYLLDAVADALNLRNLRPEVPEAFRDTFDAARYRRSQDYLRDKTRFGILVDSLMTTLTVLFILLGGFGWLDRLARSAAETPVGRGLVFAGVLVVGMQLLKIPFSVYDTFVIEEKYGFNKTRPGTFVADILRGLVLLALIGGGIFALIIWLFESQGWAAWLIVWGAVTVIQVILIFIAPVVIMPLFNTFEPLEEGELRSAIETYAAEQSFAMQGVFKMDGSRRSAKSNAFFTGFGKSRRIVLLDTLIEKHTVPELLSVIGHEMGHYRKKHILSGMVRATAQMGLMLCLLSLFIGNEGLFRAFRVTESSVYGSLVFFGFIYTPLAMVFSIIGNAIARRHEYDADAFAVETAGGAAPMMAALKRLCADNLANLTPHRLKVILEYSHPPVVERLEALEKAE